MCGAIMARPGGDVVRKQQAAVEPAGAATMRYITPGTENLQYGPPGGDVRGGGTATPVTVGTAPTPSVAALTLGGRARKKNVTDILRNGLLSNLKTGASGVGGLPWLATPAVGSELKSKLGQ